MSAVAVLQTGIGLETEVARILRSQAGAGSVIKGVAPGIGRLKLQAVRGALLEANLQRVVVGDVVGAKGCDVDIKHWIAVIGGKQGAGGAGRSVRSHRMSRSPGSGRATQHG